jgi:hypothetical protein
MRTPNDLAQKMGKELGRREILFRPLPHECETKKLTHALGKISRKQSINGD